MPATQKMELSLNELLTQREWMAELARSLLGRDLAEADDVAQEAWMDAARGRDAARSSRPWLRTIVRRRAAERGRSEARRLKREAAAARPEPSEETKPDAIVERFETQRVVAAAVSELPEPYRTTILQHYFEGTALVEIARCSDTKPATVRWRLHKGHALLREKLEARYGKNEWRAALAPLCGFRVAASAGAPALAPWLLLVPLALLAVGLSLPFWGSDEPLAPQAPTESPIGAKADEGTEKLDTPERGERIARVEDKAAAAEITDTKTESAPKAAQGDEHATLRARFVDAKGEAIEGVRVRVVAAQVDGFRREHAVLRAIPPARSDADGRAVLPMRAASAVLALVPPKMRPAEGEAWTLFAEATSPRHATRELQFSVANKGVADIGEVVLAPAGRVRGRVVDSAGRPVGGVEVRASLPPFPRYFESDRLGGHAPRGFASVRSAKFLGRGSFRFPRLPHGPVMLWVARDGYPASYSLVEVGAEEAVAADLELVPVQAKEKSQAALAWPIRVTRPDGNPAANALVVYERERPQGGVSRRSALSDRSGRCELSISPEHTRARFDVHVRAAGYAPTTRQDVSYSAEELEIELLPADPITIVAKSTMDASTLLLTEAVLKSEGGHVLERVEAKGGAESLRLNRSTISTKLYVAARGHAAATLDFVPRSDASEFVVRLDPVTTISGVVRHRDQAIAGADVVLLSKSARAHLSHGAFPTFYSRVDSVRTDAQGRFTLDVAKPGEVFALRAHKNGFAARLTPSFPCTKHGRAEMTVELTRGSRVHGRVLDPEARGIPFAVVALHDHSGLVRSTSCDATGSYVFEHVHDGDYELRSTDSKIREGAMRFLTMSIKKVQLAASNVTVRGRDLRYDIMRGSCRIEGTIRLRGTSASSWSVELRAANDDRKIDGALLRADGSYALAAERPGPYVLHFASPGGPLGVVRIDVPVDLRNGRVERRDRVELTRFEAPAPDRQGSGWLIQDVETPRAMQIRAACERVDDRLVAILAPVGTVELRPHWGKTMGQTFEVARPRKR